jgi:hypothetical protein
MAGSRLSFPPNRHRGSSLQCRCARLLSLRKTRSLAAATRRNDSSASRSGSAEMELRPWNAAPSPRRSAPWARRFSGAARYGGLGGADRRKPAGRTYRLQRNKIAITGSASSNPCRGLSAASRSRRSLAPTTKYFRPRMRSLRERIPKTQLKATRAKGPAPLHPLHPAACATIKAIAVSLLGHRQP